MLVVDDDVRLRAMLTEYLTRNGFEVTAAGTCSAAQAKLARDAFEVIVLDVALPDGSGLEVLETLRARGRAPRATLAMTGHDDSKTRRACLDAGCTDVLVKPLPIAELLRQIERHLA